MKKLNYWTACMVVLMMVFASCSKEDTISPDDTTPEMVELRFDSVLTDLTKAVNTKSHETPNCDAVDEGLDPTHVLVYLSEDPLGLDPVAGSPFELNLINVGGTWKTNQSIQLEPGTYYLQDFIVYSDEDVMWAAPHTGSDFGNYVSPGQSLPRALQVFSGTKPYERQEVLCYSEEQRDFYGFEFFIVDDIELENYCIFVNVCDEGMEYPAQFSVQAFKTFLGTRTQDPPLNIPASGSENQTFTINGAAGATVLCVPLPALEDQDVNGYELEVTLVEPDGNGYTGDDSPGYSPNYWPYNGAQPVATIIVNSNNLPSLPGAEGVNHLFIDCFPDGSDPCIGDVDMGRYLFSKYPDEYKECGEYEITCREGLIRLGMEGAGPNGWLFFESGDLPENINMVDPNDNNNVKGNIELKWNNNGKLKAVYTTPNDYLIKHVWGEANVGGGFSDGDCGQIKCKKEFCYDHEERLTFGLIEVGNGFLFRATMCVKEKGRS